MGLFRERRIVTPWLWYVGVVLMSAFPLGHAAGLLVGAEGLWLFFSGLIAFELSSWPRRDEGRSGEPEEEQPAPPGREEN